MQNDNPAQDQTQGGLSRRNRRTSRHGRNTTIRNERFEGKCDGLKGHIYDVSRGSNIMNVKNEDSCVGIKKPVLITGATTPRSNSLGLDK